MATITIVTRNKESPDSKVGISFAAYANGTLKITKVNETGLFGGSGLCVGQELLSINGVSTRGKSVGEVAAMLASLEREVTIQAGPGEKSYLLTCRFVRQQGTGNEILEFHAQQEQRVPPFLQAMGVSPRKWSRVVKSFSAELLPATQQALNMDQTMRNQMASYTSKQMAKGYVGFGTESNHERKIFTMTHQAAIQHSNLTLVANNVVSKANVNALLNGHGVMAELAFAVKPLTAQSTKQKGQNTLYIPTGLKFTPIDDSFEDDDLASSGVASLQVAESVPVVASATAVPTPSAHNKEDIYC